MGVEGDGHKVQRPRGARDAKSEEKEMDYLLEAALDFWAKILRNLFATIYNLARARQTEAGQAGRT